MGPEGEEGVVATYEGLIVVEPKYGWAIAGGTTLLRDSLTYGWQTTTWQGREWIGLPSIVRRGHDKVHRLSSAASILALWPENYFHFVTDVLPKLVLLEESGRLGDSEHVLVAQGLASTKFFQGARQCGRLSEIPFLPLIEDVAVEQLTVAHVRTIDKSMARRLRELVNTEEFESDFPDRFFVTRAPARGRLPTNLPEIEQVFTDHGFVVLDLDGMTFYDQVALFRRARHVAAIHGASLANLVWCEEQPSVLELVPSVQTGEFDCFMSLCSALALPYERVIGTNRSYAHKRASFDLEIRNVVCAIEGLHRRPKEDSASDRPEVH